MNNDILNDDELESLFSDAQKSQPVIVSDVFLDRVMVQAQAELAVAPPIVSKSNISWLGLVRDAIGGWPAIGSLATAAVVGVWIGISPPSSLDGVVSLFGADTESFEFWTEDFADSWAEG